MNKTCPQCGTSCELKFFFKNKSKRDGLDTYCKKCATINRKKIYRTKEGLLSNIYNRLKKNSIKRNHEIPSFSKDEFKIWAKSRKNFDELFEDWKMKGYSKMHIPSVDRLNNFKGYKFNNMQIVSFEENVCKHYKERYEGKNAPELKEVYKFDINGVFIERYPSASIAARANKVFPGNILESCRHKKDHYTCGGYIWSFNNKCKLK